MLKNFIKITLVAYLIYVFVFSILIFNFHPPINKKEISSKSVEDFPTGQETNDRVALIESPEDAISVRLNIIENAESTLDLAYFKLVDGKVSDLILGSILDAADRGVKVRILLDGLIQLSNLGGKVDGIFMGFKSHPNIELQIYEPLNLLLPLSWNNRLHDKMILVDNKFALIGGRNIEDRFFLKEFSGDKFVQDRDVLVYHEKDKSKNPLKDTNNESVIIDMQSYYNLLWEHKYTKPKHKYMTKRKVNKGKIYMDNLRADHEAFKDDFLEAYFKDMEDIDWIKVTLPTNGISFVSNPIGRINQDPKCLKSILNLAAKAENKILIQSPYVIPSKSIRSLFNQYNIDLEKITFLTNSEASSPNILSISAFKNHRKDIVDNKINIYEYQRPGSIHGKTTMIDNQISVVGTFNIDPRSSYINTESMVIIDSKPFYHILKKEVQLDLNNSLKVKEDYTYADHEDLLASKIPISKKIKIYILSKITFFVEHLL